LIGYPGRSKSRLYRGGENYAARKELTMKTVMLVTTLISLTILARGMDRHALDDLPSLNSMTISSAAFEPNRGQGPSPVSFIGRAQNYTVLLCEQSTRLLFSAPNDSAIHSIELQFIGSNSVKPIGVEPTGGMTNYLLGNNPAAWRRAIPNYSRIREAQLYPGIDAVFHGNGRNIEYDFIVAPGANPNRIRMRFEGSHLKMKETGGLALDNTGAGLEMAAPVAYQFIGGEKRTVAVQFSLDPGPVVRFSLGAYDHTRELVIDPTFVYSTYLGGSGEDVGNAITTDTLGNVYVTGRTTSNDFLVMNGWQTVRAGGRDAFVTKYSPTGQPMYSTYFGGNGEENALGIGLDATGAIYVTGVTASADLPVKNALQSVYGGGAQDGFVFKLTPDGGDLIYSTYLGGSGFDQSRTIAVDLDGNGYVAGNTDSPNFPLLDPIQPTYGGGFFDAFVTKLDSSGSLVFSTYLGGNEIDSGRGIALDNEKNIYLVGETRGDFPVTVGAFQTAYSGGLNDLFAVKISANGSSLVYSTYIGGSGSEQSQGRIGTSSAIHGKIIAVDRDGNAYITGETDSADFPTKNAYQAHKAGDVNAFVLKLNFAGTDVDYSTYFGGSGFSTARGIAITQGGRAWIVGSTNSTDLPLRNAYQPIFGGGHFDAFLAEFSRQGELRFATYLGGSGVDAGWSIATDSTDGVTVTGETTSVDFPTFNGLQSAYGGSTADAFVLRMMLD
jgi:Beta-propeller repeat